MTDPRALIRERATRHEEEIDSVRWLTVAELAARWRISENTVRAIPVDELHYKEFGSGERKKRRRFRADWVEAYENASGRSAA